MAMSASAADVFKHSVASGTVIARRSKCAGHFVRVCEWCSEWTGRQISMRNVGKARTRCRRRVVPEKSGTYCDACFGRRTWKPETVWRLRVKPSNGNVLLAN